MTSSFTFDGTTLRLLLTVEDKTERAVAALLERLTHATVSVHYREYGYQRSDEIKAISIHLTEPVVPVEASDVG